MNAMMFVGKKGIFKSISVLVLLPFLCALPVYADVGPLEIRYYSQQNYNGPGTTEALTDNSQHIQRLVPTIAGTTVKSIEVGVDVGVVLFEKPNYSGNNHFVTAGSTNLSNWNTTTASLIVYRKSIGSPSGIEVWSTSGSPRQFFPSPESIWYEGRGEYYSLKDTAMEHKVAFAKRWGKNIRARLDYDQSTLHIPSSTRDVDETYSFGDYNAVGQVDSVDIYYMSDITLTQWLKSRRSLGSYEAVNMFEHKDGQGRSFTSYIMPDLNTAHHTDYGMEGLSSDDAISSLELGDDVAVMLFEHDNGFGQHFIARQSMNLPVQWNDRVSSFLLFPKQLQHPHGLKVITSYSGGLFQPGRADIIFLPIHYLKSFSKIRWEQLGGSLNDRIISIERSSDMIAFSACEHPKFKGKCVVRPGTNASGLDFYPGDIGLSKKISSLEWWLIGPERDKVQRCIDHGNNITSCTYKLSSDPGHHPGPVETGIVGAESVDFEVPKVIGTMKPPPERIEGGLKKIVCDQGYFWSFSKGRCVRRYIKIPEMK